MAKKYRFMGETGTWFDVQHYAGSSSVEIHYHDFFELVFIHRGSCICRYQSAETLLVAGDVFLIPPHHEHAYDYDSSMEFYNCQFYAEKMGDYWLQFLSDVSLGEDQNPFKLKYDLREISLLHTDEGKLGSEGPAIVHLSSTEQKKLEDMLMLIRTEQKGKKTGYEHMKEAYLKILMTTLKRIQEERNDALGTGFSRDKQKNRITKAIDHINMNYTEEIEFSLLAEKFGLSSGHFRELFKKATGLTPVDYLNRLRVVKSLEFIRMENLSIADAAARVGIYDANYFSRLFKKIMGYSPRYFRNISE